jgi:Ca2+-binding RTX toxin-like protein
MEEPMPARTLEFAVTTAPLLVKPIKPILPIEPVLPLINEIWGTAADDYLYGTSGDDNIHGQAGNDTLYGLAGNDTLDGGAGNDVMAGGKGDDIYYVDDSPYGDNDGDVVWEWGGEGIDTVRVTGADYQGYTLPPGVENLELLLAESCGGYGNELDNVIIGNGAYNPLHGYAGNDRLVGGGGNDSLYGGEGNDILDGGTGFDYMVGGVGDDTYHVDGYSDQIVEDLNGGFDTVKVAKISASSEATYVLPENVENGELIGFTSNLTGNSLDNVLRGNAANNVITGGGGFDTMYGAEGADTFKYLSLSDAVAVGNGLFSDYIADFSTVEADKIDLSLIDADLLAAGDQAFRFIGNNNNYVAAFGPGQLRFNNGFVEGDVNGDLVSDFYIKVNATALPDDAFIL